jgi:hypothetical protein
MYSNFALYNVKFMTANCIELIAFAIHQEGTLSRQTKTTTVTGFVDEMGALEALGISKSQAFRDGCRMHIQSNIKSLEVMETELHLLETEQNNAKARIEFLRQAIDNSRTQNSVVTNTGQVLDKGVYKILSEFQRCSESIVYDKKTHLLTHLSKASGMTVPQIKTFYDGRTTIPTEQEILSFIKG